jgi:hypothetical protein
MRNCESMDQELIYDEQGNPGKKSQITLIDLLLIVSIYGVELGSLTLTFYVASNLYSLSY